MEQSFKDDYNICKSGKMYQNDFCQNWNFITNAEIKILHDLIDALEPVKHAVDGLCRRNATLLTAKRIYDFVFKTFSNSNSALLGIS